MTTHEIISATKTPGGVELKITWKDLGNTTTELYSQQVAKALGWKRPDPQPVDPAWMVEVARDSHALEWAECENFPMAEQCRDGECDTTIGHKAALHALRLALSRGHVVLAPVVPSEEEMLRDAREDAAQYWRSVGREDTAQAALLGAHDGGIRVQSALQACRNVYASLGAVGRAASSGPVVPEVDLAAALTAAWKHGRVSAEYTLAAMREGRTDRVEADIRDDDVRLILMRLKRTEA